MPAFAHLRLVVLGDLMLDRYLYGEVDRISPEAPVPVVQLRRTRAMAGGAGNVARNVAALGGTATLIGLLGADAAGRELRELLAAESRIEARAVEGNRPTSLKMRVVAGQQQVVRLDEETASAADATESAALLAAVDAALPGADALVLSDYAKGVLAPEVVAGAIARAHAAGLPVLVDPKAEDFARYRGADVLTPNARELARASRMPTGTEAEVVAAARAVLTAAGIGGLLCTRAERGMLLVTADAATAVPAEAREVFDVSGAGDTAIATLALAYASGLGLPAAMRVANTAAGIAVGKRGTATVGAAELDLALRRGGEEGAAPLDRDGAARLVAGWRAAGLRVGFANGCFDVLHAGHVALLRAARRRCDRLLVALNDDASVARLKGAGRPVNTLSDRAAVVGALAAVDAVAAFAEDTPLELIRATLPDLLIKGADYTIDRVVGAAEVRAAGGEVVLIDLLEGRSTTAILARGAGQASASA